MATPGDLQAEGLAKISSPEGKVRSPIVPGLQRARAMRPEPLPGGTAPADTPRQGWFARSNDYCASQLLMPVSSQTSARNGKETWKGAGERGRFFENSTIDRSSEVSGMNIVQR